MSKTSIVDWHGIYSLSFCITKYTKLQNFQFKQLHRILPVNSLLYKCGTQETKENLLHLFWNCNLVQNFWLNAKNVLLISGITLPLNAREITLGISERNIENQFTVNNILFILKCYIYRCRCKGEIPHLHRGLQYLKLYQNRKKILLLHILQKEIAN